MNRMNIDIKKKEINRMHMEGSVSQISFTVDNFL